MSYCVEEIRDLDDLHGLRDSWDSLLAETRHASYFQSLNWLIARWQHGTAQERLRVLVVSGHQGLLGFVPLCVKVERTAVGLIRVLTFPLDGWGSFYGPIGRNSELIVTAVLRYLRRTGRDFDVVDLCGLAVPTETGEWASVTAEDATLKSSRLGGSNLSEFHRVAMLDLDGDWASYWKSRKNQHSRYRNIERCYRRLNEQGHVTYLRYRPRGEQADDADPRWDLYDSCEDLASRTWQNGLEEGNTLHHEQVRPFLRDAHLEAVRAGAADVNLLYVNGLPVAFLYAYHYRGYVDLLRVGFDPAWAKMAPGNALWRHLIQDSFERQDRVLDFGPACLDYKRFWITRLEPSYRILRYVATPRPQILRAGRWLKSWLPRPKDQTNRENKAQAVSRQSNEPASPELSEV